jgi:hypothetical protein
MTGLAHLLKQFNAGVKVDSKDVARLQMVEGEGFEPSKAEPSDLQSDPFDRSGTPPNETAYCECFIPISQRGFYLTVEPMPARKIEG